ncbi:hypothetical protein ABT186_46620 [Streptomyces sp. NPDC001634]
MTAGPAVVAAGTAAAAAPAVVVAVDGDDCAPGSLAHPLPTIQQAVTDHQ